ncbi:MAG: dTDP-glucose 4,6-dehydratase [Patescibacteria group bacterium]|nr:dTDP-glucose 4,6-dehydratase [Patescibacteria group bacterium]
MKLLVTGGAGFIGSNFIHYWLKNHPDDEIINLDVLSYAGNLANLRDVEKNSAYSFVRGDITDIDLVDSLVARVDTIVHFAAESHVDRSIVNSADFVRTNVEGTRVLLDAAKNHGGVRFHHISTDEVFGALPFDGGRFNENTPYDPRSPYSASKAASDHLVRAYFHTHALPVTISNCSNNYGPYQYPEKLIPLFITNLIDGKKLPVYGQGSNVRDWIHVDDHNRGVDLILHQGKIGETYCLGGDSERSNLEITKKLLSIFGQGEDMINYVADRPGHDLRYAIDFSKAKRDLGWEPLIAFEQGLADSVDWYRRHEDWWRPIVNAKTKN